MDWESPEGKSERNLCDVNRAVEKRCPHKLIGRDGVLESWTGTQVLT